MKRSPDAAAIPSVTPVTKPSPGRWWTSVMVPRCVAPHARGRTSADRRRRGRRRSGRANEYALVGAAARRWAAWKRICRAITLEVDQSS